MEGKSKIGFIINPISGTRQKADLPMLIKGLIDKTKFDLTIQYTECAGHANKLAQEMAKDGFNIVVSVGGDGTMNEVASALIHTNTALGIVPCGSGNGLARHLGIPLNLRDAINLLNNAKVVEIDYGTANDVKFFCTCGVGFDAHIGHQFASSKKRGFFTYLKSILGEFFKYKAKKYKFKTTDKKFKKRAFLVTLANASQYGNDAFIAPNADIQDGLLDVAILEPFRAYKAIGLGMKLMSKKIDQSRHVEILRVGEVMIKRKRKDVFHYDGEPCIMKKKIKVQAHKGGLKVAVLPESNLRQTI
jgi:YegS/Rv2252/BmrU family lipid kinase